MDNRAFRFSLSAILIVTFLLTSKISVSAQGLLASCPAGNPNCSDTQRVFPTYNPPNVPYRTDLGVCGDVSDPAQVTNDVLTTWNNVSTSRVVFQNQGNNSVDVDENNFAQFLSSPNPLGFTLVAYDDDGALTSALLGQGAEQVTLGFAGPTFTNFNGNIVESQAVFNGSLFTAANTGQSASQIANNFRSTVLHELGHAIGLDHVQVYLSDFNNFTNLTRIPIMFPIAANPGFALLLDDRVSISAPANYASNTFASSTGTITGSVRSSGGQALRGANVTAYNVANLNETVSSVSNIDAQDNGTFIIPGLTPGVNYAISVEAINSQFTGGSGVGPDGPPNNPGSIPSGFFNGNNQQLLNINIDQAVSQAATVSPTAGGTITINFNGNTTTTDTQTGGGNNGGDNSGGDNSGGDNSGGDNSGGDNSGGDNSGGDNSGGDNSGGDGNDDIAVNPSFEFRGGVLNRGVVLRDFGRTRARFKLRRVGPRRRVSISLSSDQPNLVSFRRDLINIGRRARNRRVVMVLASLDEFLAAFPNFDTEGAEITVTATDLDTGFSESTTISIF